MVEEGGGGGGREGNNALPHSLTDFNQQVRMSPLGARDFSQNIEGNVLAELLRVLASLK
jgi:hypothetical protein